METIRIIEPFLRVRSGLMPSRAVQVSSSALAAQRAEKIAHEYAGIVAYSMDVDEEGGDYGQPVVHFKAGDVPELE